jgi:DeoR family transcriptional regulator of aga operon
MPEVVGKISRDTSDRRRQISAMIRSAGSVQVFALSELFGVSMPTIRKDLHYLEQRGVASRSYGGAIAAEIVNVHAEPPIESKPVSHPEEKMRIGDLAASLVEVGDSIMLDSGTTALAIARSLPELADLTVVTNDFNILGALIQKPNIKIIMLGGELRRINMAFNGVQTIAALDELLLDKLFLGVDGFDVGRGLTTHQESESQLNRKMVGAARRVIAVTDSSKFGRVCLHRIVDIREIDDLITDSAAPAYIHEAAERQGFRLHLA